MPEASGTRMKDDEMPEYCLPTRPNLKISGGRFTSNDLRLLETQNFADVDLICDDRTWKLHRSIICQRCVWFEKALNGNFKESETNTITINEFSPDLIDTLIHYLYSGVIDNTKVKHNQSPVSGFCSYILLWVVGDFFLLDELKEDALSGLRSHCEDGLRSSMIGNHLSPVLMQGILEELSAGVDIAYTVYPHAEPCQKALVDFVYVGRLRIFNKQSFIDLITKVPVFAADVFRCTLKGGKDNYWLGTSSSDYRKCQITSRCDSCTAKSEDEDRRCLNPKTSEDNIRLMKVRWRCQSCVGVIGYPWQRGKLDGELAE